MAILFDYEQHKKLWLLMRDNIRGYVSGRAITSYYDAEVTVDDLKALQFKNENMGTEFKDNTRIAPLFFCYACQYAWDYVRGENELAEKRERCTYCPLEGWNAENCFAGSVVGTEERGLFFDLVKAVEDGEIDLAEQICEAIANLPVRDGVETGNGTSTGGGITNPNAKTLNPGGVCTLRRENALSKAPVSVLTSNGNAFVYNPLATAVYYSENSVDIVNVSSSTISFLVIANDDTVYSTAVEYTLQPRQGTTYSRAGNLNKVPVTVLIKDTFSSNSSLGLGKYTDATPYLTIAHDESTTYIYNETDETITYVVLSGGPVTRTTSEIPAGSAKNVGTKQINKGNALSKTPPKVLIKDTTVGSKTYNKYLDSTGLVDTVVYDDYVVFENYLTYSLNALIVDPIK